jgi:hypothetical protein
LDHPLSQVMTNRGVSADSIFELDRHCERKRSNPSRRKKEWIASSLCFSAMTSRWSEGAARLTRPKPQRL